MAGNNMETGTGSDNTKTGIGWDIGWGGVCCMDRALRKGRIIKENCRQFLDDVRQTLDWKELSVQAVIVTGSGSRMPCTVEMSVKAFPESLFLPVHRYTEW